MRLLTILFLLPCIVARAQTRSVVINTNAPLSGSFIPYSVSDVRVANSPIARTAADAVAVSNAVISARSVRGVTVLTGTNTTVNGALSQRFTWSLTGNSTNNITNIVTSTALEDDVFLTVTSDGTRTLDFASALSTNWVTPFFRTPRNGQTTYSFINRGSTIDIGADPPLYPTTDGQVLRQTESTLNFGFAPAMFYSGSLVTVSNTTTETTLYTNTIPAGILGTNKCFRVIMLGEVLNNTGGASNFQFKVYLGSTKYYDDSIQPTSGANYLPARVECVVGNKDSASAQHISFWVATGAGGSPTTGTGRLNNNGVSRGPVYGTGAENSANALGFGITMTPQHAVGTMVWNTRYTVLAPF